MGGNQFSIDIDVPSIHRSGIRAKLGNLIQFSFSAIDTNFRNEITSSCIREKKTMERARRRDDDNLCLLFYRANGNVQLFFFFFLIYLATRCTCWNHLSLQRNFSLSRSYARDFYRRFRTSCCNFSPFFHSGNQIFDSRPVRRFKSESVWEKLVDGREKNHPPDAEINPF